MVKKKERCCEISKKGNVCKKKKYMDLEVCSIHKPKESCVICFNEFSKKNSKILDCFHKYCFSCISNWVYLEGNDNCPLCRKHISGSDYNDMFEYCFNNKLITKYIYYDYILNDPEVIDFITPILQNDSDYSLAEWKTFETYLSYHKDMYEKFFKDAQIVRYCYYQKFNPLNQGYTKYGKSFIYNYKVKY
jgi:hypothetical protein